MVMFLSSLISVCGVLFLSSLATEAFQYGKVQNYCRVQVPGRRGDDLGGRVVFMEENLRYRMPVTSLEVKRNSFDVNMDIDALEREAHEFKPDLIIAGFSAYPRDLDYKRFRHICILLELT